MSTSNNTATTTEKVQDAATAVYDTTAGYVQQAGETTKNCVNGARQYVSDAVAPPKSPTTAEKIQEGAQDAMHKIEEAAEGVADKINGAEEKK
jgi:ABC-type transporter Mla subunit MlaD